MSILFNYIFLQNNIKFLLLMLFSIILLFLPNISIAVISYPIIIFHIYLGINMLFDKNKPTFIQGLLSLSLSTLLIIIVNISLYQTNTILGIYFLLDTLSYIKNLCLLKEDNTDKIINLLIVIINIFLFIILTLKIHINSINIITGVLVLVYSILKLIQNKKIT